MEGAASVLRHTPTTDGATMSALLVAFPSVPADQGARFLILPHTLWATALAVLEANRTAAAPCLIDGEERRYFGGGDGSGAGGGGGGGGDGSGGDGEEEKRSGTLDGGDGVIREDGERPAKARRVGLARQSTATMEAGDWKAWTDAADVARITAERVRDIEREVGRMTAVRSLLPPSSTTATTATASAAVSSTATASSSSPSASSSAASVAASPFSTVIPSEALRCMRALVAWHRAQEACRGK